METPARPTDRFIAAALDDVAVVAEAPAGGAHPQRWAHRRALASVDGHLGWWEEGSDSVDRRVPSST